MWMDFVITMALGAIALVWVAQAIRGAIGMRHMPHVRDAQPLADADCPSVSILFTARDEEKKLPQALATLLALDYPRYEVIAVNDRSTDATARILDEAASRHPRLKVIHIPELPPGWLGKPHGLQRAYEASSGEWLIFTDADVRFAPDLLRRALAIVREKRWDHLVLLGLLELTGVGEKILAAYMAVALLWVEPWQVCKPRSRRFVGAGYFMLVRRAAYEAVGTHQRLRMEVVEDLKLGKMVKRGGFVSGAGIAEESIQLRYCDGLRDTVRNFEKNGFGITEFKTWLMLGIVLAILLNGVAPFVALPFVTGWAQAFAALAALTAVSATAVACAMQRISPLYGLAHPLGALIFCCTLLRSMVITLRQGGIYWRGTFYPLADIRKGVV